MAENWLTTPQATDLYNFIKQHILVIFPLNDYEYNWQEDIDRKILYLRCQEGKTDDNWDDLCHALKQLVAEGTLTAHHTCFGSTLTRETGNFN